MSERTPDPSARVPSSGGHATTFAALREQLLAAAETFAGGPSAVPGILSGLVDDVDRALSERLEIFPVCHHSPASALAMAARLRDKQPKVIYLELCEDLRPLLDELRNCRLPVAVQAFASEIDGFPASWAPLSVVAPITEASAEYQAIAYALDTPDVELVLVDRSTDHVFQWAPHEPPNTTDPTHRTAPANPAGEVEGPGPAGADPASEAGPASGAGGVGLVGGAGPASGTGTTGPAAGASPASGAGPHSGQGGAGLAGGAGPTNGVGTAGPAAGAGGTGPAAGAGPVARAGGAGPAGGAGAVGGVGGRPAGEDDAALHGDAVGIEIGDLRPGFAELEEHLLHHGKVRHWSEWWDQYVEQPLVGADHDTYRQVMVLIGSLFRRLRPDGHERLERDEDRERYMWTRMREHLAASGADPADCLYVCGAFHAASPVEQFGVDADAEPYEISPRTETRWLYGLIPSSHSAIEAQFGLAAGSVSIAAATWAKALKHGGVTPFRLKGQKGAAKKARRARTPVAAEPVTDRLSGFLARPPALDAIDESELLGWCVDIVRLARRNGYLASTADAIAVFETSVLLAGLRGRRRPTPYDFQDAAITCIEKDVVPGRRDVRRLCEILLGGDRVGQVGYEALPPLARDVLDRLEPLGLDLEKRTIQRALLDLDARPELVPCSHLLWILRRLLPDDAVRPIMGSRRLGERSIQESWDLAIGRNQRSLVELAYEGVTVEQVLEQRLRRAVWAERATAAVALDAVEQSILYLGGRRLTDELGARAVELLSAERTVDDAPEVLRRIRRLLTHYRATERTLPQWCEAFVTTGYAHYCTLLPTAFVDEETGVRQVAAMLGFLFSMESLALSLGCDHAQLELAVRQSHPRAPAKVALVWAASSQLGLLSLPELRSRCDDLLANPLVVPAFPLYISGFVQALEPAPGLAPLVVEVISKAFARLPDTILLPWLPKLITTLREHANELVPVLVREAGRTFPASLPAIDTWVPPWSERPAPAIPPSPVRSPTGPVAHLLTTHPTTHAAVADLLGYAREDGGGLADPEVRALTARHPETADAIARLLVGGAVG